jgi:hypothetical protein
MIPLWAHIIRLNTNDKHPNSLVILLSNESTYILVYTYILIYFIHIHVLYRTKPKFGNV